MATYGKLDEFQCDSRDAEAWNEYCERLGHYFVANKVTDAAIKKFHITQCLWSKNLQADEKPSLTPEARRSFI